MGKRPNEEYLDIANSVRKAGVPLSAEEISIKHEISLARATYILKYYLSDFQPRTSSDMNQDMKPKYWGQSKDDFFFENPRGTKHE